MTEDTSRAGIKRASLGREAVPVTTIDKIEADGVRVFYLERGTAVSAIRHKTPIGAWDGGFAPGLDPARGDYASFASFSDPDGNRWVLQERGYGNA